MEVLVPINCESVAENVNKVVDESKTKLIALIKAHVPVGYAFVSSSSSAVVGHAVALTTIDKVKLHRVCGRLPSPFGVEYLVLKTGESVLHISERTKAVDLYKLCGMMQIIKDTDLFILGNMIITNEEVEQ